MVRLKLSGLVLASALFAVTCFDPDYQAGIECSGNGTCPSGLECASDGRCYPEGEGPPDASVNGDGGGTPDGGSTGECNVLEQDCPEGMKCSYIAEALGPPANGRISCVPDGSLQPGEPCIFDQEVALGVHDDCKSGLVCSASSGGVCVPYCDPLGPPACDGPLPSSVCARPGLEEVQVHGGLAPFGACVTELADEVASGPVHTCALSNGGRVKCWGDNGAGQLGYPGLGDVGDDERPIDVGFVEIGERVVDLDTGGSSCAGDTCDVDLGHTCAVLASGSVQCWGANSHGQLGIGSTEPVSQNLPPSEIPAVDVGGKAIAVSAGWAHTCALLEDGAIKCWGLNDFGQLGLGEAVTRFGDTQDDDIANSGPIAVGGAVLEVSAGNKQTCARLAEGVTRCWGGPGDSLGYPNRSATNFLGDDELPTDEGFLELPPSQTISASLGYSCSVSQASEISCWGYAGSACSGLGVQSDGILGDDEAIPAINLNVPLRQLDFASRTESDVEGNVEFCQETWLLDGDGQIHVFGPDVQGAEGFRFGNPNLQIVQLAVGRDHQCGLLDDPSAPLETVPEVYCYGQNQSGQLGAGDTDVVSLSRDQAVRVSIF